MEFVLVTFPEPRTVNMESVPLGPTGQVLLVERGTHVFDLGSPPNYAPPSVQTLVAGTSQAQPLQIDFQLVAVPVPAGGPSFGLAPTNGGPANGGAPTTPPVAAKRRTKKAPKRKAPRKPKSRKTRAKAKPARRSLPKKRGRGRK